MCMLILPPALRAQAPGTCHPSCRKNSFHSCDKWGKKISKSQRWRGKDHIPLPVTPLSGKSPPDSRRAFPQTRPRHHTEQESHEIKTPSSVFSRPEMSEAPGRLHSQRPLPSGHAVMELLPVPPRTPLSAPQSHHAPVFLTPSSPSSAPSH